MFGKIIKIIIILVILTMWIPLATVATGEQNLQGKVVILDPGHGEENTNSYEGYDEQVTMFALAQKIKPILESRGATVYMTRSSYSEVILPVRSAMINKWALLAARDSGEADPAEADRLITAMQSVIDDPETNAPVYFNYPFDYTYTRTINPDLEEIFDFEAGPSVQDHLLVVSLHSNATGKPINTAEQGAYAYYISNNLEKNMTYYSNYSAEKANAYFAEQILDNIDAIGINKREAKDYYFHILRENNVPCVLVENGFHTNDHDRALLSDDAFLDRLALVYADTIFDYFIWLDTSPSYRGGWFDKIFGAFTQPER